MDRSAYCREQPPPDLLKLSKADDPEGYQSTTYGARQTKAARAAEACEMCRRRKRKCDEGRPACSHCIENSLICVYQTGHSLQSVPFPNTESRAEN
ncbi:C6 finger domain protein [Penicillium sp. IBT 18751x]|nr:C6 finger domain protein [Penicillium sp. IBT 18751x]